MSNALVITVAVGALVVLAIIETAKAIGVADEVERRHGPLGVRDWALLVVTFVAALALAVGDAVADLCRAAVRWVRGE
jgi:hypothetical protein